MDVGLLPLPLRFKLKRDIAIAIEARYFRLSI